MCPCSKLALSQAQASWELESGAIREQLVEKYEKSITDAEIRARKAERELRDLKDGRSGGFSQGVYRSD